MAISSILNLREAMAGAQVIPIYKESASAGPRNGRMYDLWAYSGNPISGGVPANSLAGTVLSKNTAGALQFANAAVSSIRLAQANMIATTVGGTPVQTGVLYVIDRLWHNNGITCDFGTQSWTPSGAITRYATGEGLRVLMTMWTPPSARNNNVTHTMTYTNQAGVSTSAGVFFGWANNSSIMNSANECLFLALAAGDTGVRAVTAMTKSQQTLGASYGVAIVKVLAAIPCYEDFAAGYMSNFLSTLLPEIDNNACISFLYATTDEYTASATSNPFLSGSISLIEG